MHQHGFGATSRRDGWWVQPLLTFLGLSAFIVYATWAAFQGDHYTYGSYLSPFYSPEIFGESPHSWFGPKPAFWPAFLPFSPALLILWAMGVGYCNITKCCTKVCPVHIAITDNAIIPLKERVVDEFYDPVKKLFRLFAGR